ncbi:MAG TPA: hypothetical protein VF058_00270 [Actinomycetota bacterium]
MIAVPGVWSVPLVGATSLLVVVGAVLVSGIARGRIAMELGWGRSRMSLRDRRVEIAAPPDVVLHLLRQAAAGEVPGVTERERTEVIDADGDLIVNESLNDSRFGMVRAREAVRFHPDGRVTYRHLAGPLPGTEEAFEVKSADGGSVLTYHGGIPVDFWALGRLVARFLILPEYERLLDEHLAALTKTAEARARRRRT